MEKIVETTVMPAIVIKGLVVFPKMVLHFDILTDKSVLALKAAAEGNRKVFLVSQKGLENENPSADDIYKIGVIAEVRQIVKSSETTTRVLVEGLQRAEICSFTQTEPYCKTEVKEIIDKRSASLSAQEEKAIFRMLTDQFGEYASCAPQMPDKLYANIFSAKSLEALIDLIIFNVYMEVENKQKLLETSGIKQRAKLLITMLAAETEILKIEIGIQEQVRNSIIGEQKEYYLRQKIKAIQSQLGDKNEREVEVEDYHRKICALKVSDEIRNKLFKEEKNYRKMHPYSPDAAPLRVYLDTMLEIPFGVYTKDKTDIEKAERQLDADHYGLKKVKERIIELIAAKALNPDIKGQILCLVGPPGVGKTSIGKSVAKALGRKYARISLGGVRDEAEIRGHIRTYIGSMPGRIIKALIAAKSSNPVIMLDEVDKLGNDYKGDPSSALLEVLDPEQNFAFVDHYIEVPIDLSKVLFITTANNADNIPSPLLDRMEVIELGSYTREEKYNIARKHLVPKQLKIHGETAVKVKITNESLYSLIDNYTREAGVRKLEQKIAALCRKSAKKLVQGDTKVIIGEDMLHEFLGVKRYLPETLSCQDEVGIVNGLAWTAVGGVIMPLEVLIMEGTGKVEATGSLGDVMKESSKLAVSLVRSFASEYNIDKEFYKNCDIHIHAPEGAVPKDGPSAGVTMTTALVSALSGYAVRHDIAMTGEITLHGKILPIGGLKEKTMAAYKAGIKTVIIPKDNETDLQELDPVIKDNIKFIVAEQIKTVLEIALIRTNSSEIKPLKKEPEKIISVPNEIKPENIKTVVI